MKTSPTNDITIRQNESEFIELLKAQRVAYSQNKWFILFDLSTPVFALFLPLLITSNKEWELRLGIISGILTIIYMFFTKYRKKKNETAAKIQEEFDTELFNLKWNDKETPYKVSIEEKTELAKKYNKGGLDNWYSHEVKASLPHKIAVLLCQRINLSWEISLKESYVKKWKWFTLIYYLVLLIILLWYNIPMQSVLLILLPSIPLLTYAIPLHWSVKDQIGTKQEALNKVDKALENYTKDKNDVPSKELLREIQDAIFKNRKEPEKIPDWYYNRNRNKDELNMHEMTALKVKSLS